MTALTNQVWKARTIVALATPLVILSACRSQSGGATPEECAPISSELPPASSAAALAGEYRLRLVATSGAKKGAATEGTLRLDPQAGGLLYRTRLGGTRDSTVLHPFYGAAEVDLAAIDAVSVGNTTSLDPMQPGVLVMERRAAPSQPPAEIMMRLGSDANRRDRQRFDGGYTALRVRQVGPDRFAGSWSSGVTGERAAGYFCAERTRR